ncbi:MAG TPA: 50S ribosomal protein L20 [Myxococcota bacterium]|nr:50S ribosomal protein L20 [Myxococcota bacterium]HQK52014.1 50S ribosomal protein L20 [Myxococcota bacterium]
MARVKRGFKRRRRTNKIFKAAQGFWGRRRTTWRRTVETVHRAWAFATIHRKLKKRDFRSLWIARINAACRMNGTRYSDFVHALATHQVRLDRKVLADIAVHDPDGFGRIVRSVTA